MTMLQSKIFLHVEENAAAVAETAAKIISRQAKVAIAERNIFRIALSGGSTPLMLFRLLRQESWRREIDWSKTAVYWADERCIHPENELSNYRLADIELLSSVSPANVYRMKGEEPPAQAAQMYAEDIRASFGLSAGSMPRFDTILLGMGEDGHTASIFPGLPMQEDPKSPVAGVSLPEPQVSRITLTLPAINNSRCCLFMVTGANKRQVLERVLNYKKPAGLPAQLVRPHDGELHWVMDFQASPVAS